VLCVCVCVCVCVCHTENLTYLVAREVYVCEKEECV
jgi:hypothetical protein